MTFEEILDRVLEMLQRRGRVSYRALKRQFDLDDAYLEDVKEEILFSHHQVVDEDGRGLVWTGEPGKIPTPASGKEPALSPSAGYLTPPPPPAIPTQPEDLGRHTLKGVAEPMPVFRVDGPIDVHEDEEETTAAGVPLLIGRDEEIGLLVRRWEQAKAGLGQVVLVNGETGIGKSALVEVLRARVRGEGFPRIVFRGSPYHTTSALYPVIEHLQRFLRFQREDPAAVKLARLEQGLQASRLPLAEVVPLFAALLSASLDGRYPALTLSPQQQRQQTLDALVAWLMAEAKRQPVLTVWEDLHLADPSTLDLLGLLLEQTPTVPMLNVLMFRPEFRPPWPTGSHMTPITLNRLERPQVEALISQLAGAKALPVEVIAHIVAKTDGVPLYVEELTKMVLDQRGSSSGQVAM